MKEVFAFLLAFVFVLGAASAAMTTVHVKTYPHCTVFLTPLDNDEHAIMTPLQGFSNLYGDVTFEFDTDESVFDLIVLVKNNSHVVYFNKFFEDYVSGEDVGQVLALPEGVEPLVDPRKKVVVENISTEDNSTEENVSTGNASAEEENVSVVEGENFFGRLYNSFEKDGGFFKKIYYSILGVLAFLILLFLILPKLKKIGKKKKKKSDKGDDVDDLEDQLKEAEEELKKAKKRVEDLKKRKELKVAEAKKKLIEAEKELIKLRGSKVAEEKDDDLKKRLEKELKKKD